MEGLMKWLIMMLSLTMIVGSAFQGWEGEQVKSDLAGLLKFQSPSHITEFFINDKREDTRQRVYSVTFTMQDPKAAAAYKAEADMIYNKVGSAWEIGDVGLKSFEKIE